MNYKIFIVGAGGSGKTTLAKEISKKLKIKSKSIDDFKYSKNFKIKFSKEKLENNLKKFLRKKEWILEGVCAGDYILPALENANLIVVLKSSRIKLLIRILKREFKRKKTLKELAKLLYWSQKYKTHNETSYLKLEVEKGKKIVVLKNEKKIKEFVKSLR